MFDINLVDIGWPTRVDVGHDGHGAGADWAVDEVRLENSLTSELFVFPCGKWLVSGIDRESFPVKEVAVQDVRVEAGALEAGRPVLFFPWSTVLRPSAKDVLDAVAAYLLKSPQIAKVVVTGHSNNAAAGGSVRMLQGLSVSRAQAAIRSLVERGVAEDRLVARGQGQGAQAAAANAAGANAAAGDKARVTFVLPDQEVPEFV